MSLLAIFSFIAIMSQCFAADQSDGVPRWLEEHVGETDGKIADVVLQKARALYLRKVAAPATLY